MRLDDLGGYRLGYVLNFNVTLLKQGTCRMANGLDSATSAPLRELRG